MRLGAHAQADMSMGLYGGAAMANIGFGGARTTARGQVRNNSKDDREKEDESRSGRKAQRGLRAAASNTYT